MYVTTYLLYCNSLNSKCIRKFRQKLKTFFVPSCRAHNSEMTVCKIFIHSNLEKGILLNYDREFETLKIF